MYPGLPDGRADGLAKWGLPLALLAGTSAYYRFRPVPSGINCDPVTFRVPLENIRFHHDSTWYEQGQRHCIREITPQLIRLIRNARRFVVMDVFLFSLHHAQDKRDLIPTTRQIVDALASRDRPAWFITDPLNIMYGTAESPPITWLRQAGVHVCITDLNLLRDNNLLYSPLWRLGLRWIPKTAPPWFQNPLEATSRTTLWAMLDGINARGNHRKLLIADDGDDYVTLATSSNFEDASCYFANTGVTIRSAPVARHVLEAEKAVAALCGMQIPVSIPRRPDGGEARVTPLMGSHIKSALIDAIDRAGPSDYLFMFTQYLSDRELIEALIRASNRGLPGTLVLDQNKVSFGNPKFGFPNQLTAPELARRTRFEIRWANTDQEEFHNVFTLIQGRTHCTMFLGSANYTRRGLSNTVLEANVKIHAPSHAPFCLDALEYAHWLLEEPHSLPFDAFPGTEHYWPKYLLHRFLEASGSGTC